VVLGRGRHRPVDGREPDRRGGDRRGTEIWQVTNAGGAHNFHVHGVLFRVVDVDGRAPGPQPLRHHDDGMMGQFAVVGPGQRPEPVDHSAHAPAPG
jgi:hypothetical protein